MVSFLSFRLMAMLLAFLTLKPSDVSAVTGACAAFSTTAKPRSDNGVFWGKLMPSYAMRLSGHNCCISGAPQEVYSSRHRLQMIRIDAAANSA